MGAGMGIMIGKKQSKDNYYIDETTHKATTLGSTDGKVTVQAGDTVHLTTTNAVGKDGVTIVGQDIILDGKDDVYKQEERHERKSSGLTVSLGGSVVEKLDSAVKKQHSASNRKNNHFKSLEGKQSSDRLLSAIGEAKRIVDRSYNGQMRTIESQLERVNTDIVNTPETDTAKLAELKSKQELLMKKRSALEENKSVVDKATDKAIDRAINVQIGIGSSKNVAESKLERYTYSSGTIDSDGTVLIHANSADSIKGNITAIGEQIKGEDVQLAASNTINLEAGSNMQRVETNSNSSGWNVSANIGMRTGGLVGWSASAYKGTENGIEDSTTHTGTHVVGSNKVSITSGNDTNLTGSTISGKSVTANVGNNLTVESLQDSQIYHETSKSNGLSISGANFISQPTINGVNVKGNIDSTYTSVTEQSGIHAGSDGMNLAVGNTTTLKGATITSKATPEKNKMSTKSLVMEDIHNEASYKAKKSGIAMNTSGLTAKGVLGKINPLGLSPVVSIPVSDEVQSTTKSAISDDILVEVEHKPLTTINRDTEHALNSIKPIFDKADVKERMEYVNAVSDEGFKLIGDIAMKQAQKYEEKAAITTDEALKKRYQKEADKWKDGGIYKVALHGGFGAVVSNMAGSSSLEGFTVSSANEVMVGAIAKELAKHPNSTADANGKYVDNSDVYKIASAILGNTVSHSSLGAGISLSATQNNYLTHEQIKLYKQEYSKAKSNEEREAIDAKWQKIYFQQAREILDEMYALHNKIIKDEVGVNNPSKVSEYYNAVRALFARHGYYFKMGDLPTLDLNENGYRDYKSSFKTFGLPRNGRSSIFKSIGIRRYYDKDLTPLDREKLGFVKRNENITPKTIIKPEFVWTKDDLGKSVAQNMLSEVGNQPWVGYVHYAEKASKFARTVSRTGGPVLIGYLAKDLYMDYQVYSGRELAKAWGADLIPVATGLGGGLVGSGAGPVGAFAVGVAGATFGDRIKDEIKFNLKKDVDK